MKKLVILMMVLISACSQQDSTGVDAQVVVNDFDSGINSVLGRDASTTVKRVEVGGTFIDSPDRAYLVSLYQATDGSNWINKTNWLTNAPIGTWYGIETDAVTGSVVKIKLNGNKLIGILPEGVGSLLSLKEFDLHENYLRAVIPSDWGECAELSVINLSNNYLSGPIPFALTGCQRLESLNFYHNLLTGELAADFTKLPLFTSPAGNFNVGMNTLSGQLPKEYIDYEGWKAMYSLRKIVPQYNKPEGFTFPTKVSQDYSQDGVVVQVKKATLGKGSDFVILGDGFIDEQVVPGGEYDKMMLRVAESLFTIEPFITYKEYFNVYFVRVVSKNVSSPVYFMPNETALKVNAPDSFTFSTFDITKATNYAKKALTDVRNVTVIIVPNYSDAWDKVPTYDSFRASTTSSYSGSYQSYSFVRVPPNHSAVTMEDIIHHEANGHGYGLLTDEYVLSNSITSSAIADIKAYHTRLAWLNVDLTGDLSVIRWKHFFDVPKYQGIVGAFAGGALFLEGVWRPEKQSCMDDLYCYFNGPSREAIVKRIKFLSGEEFSWDDFVANDIQVSPPMAIATDPKTGDVVASMLHTPQFDDQRMRNATAPQQIILEP